MRLERLAKTWNAFGERDPMWAILSRQDKGGNRWDPEEFFATGRAEIDDVLAYAREHMDVKTGRALDFGCGIGRLSRALSIHFDDVHGVDVAASMIARAREFRTGPGPTLGHPDRCTFHLNERPDLRLFPDRHFDFIYSNITLQHMEPRLSHGYLREFGRVLSATGALIFQLPTTPKRERSRAGQLSWNALRSGYRFWLRRVRRSPVMDMYGTSGDEVEALFDREAFRIVDVIDADMDDWHSSRYFVTRLELRSPS